MLHYSNTICHQVHTSDVHKYSNFIFQNIEFALPELYVWYWPLNKRILSRWQTKCNLRYVHLAMQVCSFGTTIAATRCHITLNLQSEVSIRIHTRKPIRRGTLHKIVSWTNFIIFMCHPFVYLGSSANILDAVLEYFIASYLSEGLMFD